MMNNCEHIPFDLGVKLKEIGYWEPGCLYETSYNNSCYFITSKKLYIEGVVAPWDEIVPAPTYSQLFDWLSKTYRIVITLKPFFTWSLKDNIAYFWNVSYIDYTDLDCPFLHTVSEEEVFDNSEGFGGSFKLTANAAIKYAIKLIKEQTVRKYEESN